MSHFCTRIFICLSSFDPLKCFQFIDISAASSLAFSNTQSLANATPSEVLQRMKEKKSLKAGIRNASMLKQNASSTHKTFGKHFVSTTGGGTVQQVLDNPYDPNNTQDRSKKSSIPYGAGEQYLMQGNKESFSRRGSKNIDT